MLHSVYNNEEISNMGKNWQNRDRKQRKKKNGMRISGRSLFTLIDIQEKKAKKIRRRPKNPEQP